MAKRHSGAWWIPVYSCSLLFCDQLFYSIVGKLITSSDPRSKQAELTQKQELPLKFFRNFPYNKPLT